MRKLFVFIGGVLVLGLITLIVAIEFFSRQPRRFTGKLEDVFPESVAGWTRKPLPFATSKAQLAEVQGTLNYSQATQFLYTKGKTEILVYVAYWEPGKASVVDAGTHNPDSCWVNSGCLRADRAYSVSARIGRRELLPYEYGEYIMPRGGKQNVIFWHLVNGQPNRYQEQEVGWREGVAGRIERLPLMLKDFRTYGLNQKSEQMFIRISSFAPIQSLLNNPDNAELFYALDRLGIFKDQAWK